MKTYKRKNRNQIMLDKLNDKLNAISKLQFEKDEITLINSVSENENDIYMGEVRIQVIDEKIKELKKND